MYGYKMPVGTRPLPPPTISALRPHKGFRNGHISSDTYIQILGGVKHKNHRVTKTEILLTS